MHSNRLSAGCVVVALAFAGVASAQVSTTCQAIGQQLYCNSTAPPQAPANYGAGGPGTYGYQHVLTPTEAQQQAAEAQLATIRAQQAQAELDAYRQELAQRRANQEARTELQARRDAFAAKLLRCSEANPTDAGYNACMGGETPP